MIVTVNPKPTALAGDDKAVCAGGSVQIGGEAAATGYTYSWSPSTGLDDASSAQPTATPSVTTTYTVTKTYTATGCFATDSMIVTVNPKPTAMAGDDKAVCAGGSVQIGGEAAATGYTYSWSPTTGLDDDSSAQPTATPSVTTTYTVTKTYTATGCFATDSMIVTVNSKPTALAGDDKAVCAGGSVQIGGEAAATGYTYSWSPTTGLDDDSSAQPTATPSVTTTYTVTKTYTATGCFATDSVIVTVNPLPDCTITVPTSVCTGSEGNDAGVKDAGLKAKYEWSITGGTITSTEPYTNAIKWMAGPDAGQVTLSVKVTNGDNCASDTCTKQVTISKPDCTITSPDTICPDCTGNIASVPVQDDATYKWVIVSGGTITSADNMNTIEWTSDTTGKAILKVTVTKQECSKECSKEVRIAYTAGCLHPGGRYEIKGIKFNDLNGNGQKDDGESGLAEWTINLEQSIRLVQS